MFLSYLPYHIPKDSFKKLFIINECNLYEKGFDMLYSIKNNHSEETLKKSKTPLDFFIILSSTENKAKFENLNKKKYSNSWLNFENSQLSIDSSKKNKEGNSSFVEETGSFGKDEVEKKSSFQNQSFEKLRKNKTIMDKAKEPVIRITDISEIDNLINTTANPFNNNANNNPFWNYFITSLEKDIKEYLLRKLIQKLEKENSLNFYKKHQNQRIFDYFFDSNPYLDKTLKKQKKVFNFCLSNRVGLFNQRAIVLNKISAQKSTVEKVYDDFDISPSKRRSIIKKTSGVDYFTMPESFPSMNIQEDENLPDLDQSNLSVEDLNEANKEEIMLETEIEIEELDDYVFVFSENEGVSKVYKDSLAKLKKILSTNENIESFYSVTYLKSFGFLSGLFVITKRSLYILKNWGYDDKQGLFDFNESPTNQYQEKDKFMLLTKGLNIYLMAPLRKTTYMDESTITENPLDLNKSGYLASSDCDPLGGLLASNKKYQQIKIPLEKVIEISTKRYLLSHCAIEIHTVKKSYFLIVGKEKREKFFEDVKRFLPNKISKIPFSKENFLYTLLYKVNPFIFDHDNLNYQLFHTIDSQNLLKLALPLWQDGVLDNFDYIMLLNMLSGRTYNDLSQYPVFPWVLRNFSSEYGKINLNNNEEYRDLCKPIGALLPERAEMAKEYYIENQETAPFHYGSHYSNPGIVTYYLMRIMPFGQMAMDLQGFLFN